MLPLDKLSDHALQALSAAGVDTDALDVAFYMDLGLDANFGQVYLAISKQDGKIYRVAEEVESFSLRALTDASIDHFTTTNRLTATLHKEDDVAPEKTEDMTDEEFRELKKA